MMMMMLASSSTSPFPGHLHTHPDHLTAIHMLHLSISSSFTSSSRSSHPSPKISRHQSEVVICCSREHRWTPADHLRPDSSAGFSFRFSGWCVKWVSDFTECVQTWQQILQLLYCTCQKSNTRSRFESVYCQHHRGQRSWHHRVQWFNQTVVWPTRDTEGKTVVPPAQTQTNHLLTTSTNHLFKEVCPVPLPLPVFE